MGYSFPNTTLVMNEPGASLEKFNHLYQSVAKDVGFGFFLLHVKVGGKDEAIYLFVVSGRPYAAGRIEKDGPSLLEVSEFFSVYSKAGTGNLFYFSADKKLLQCLLLYFSKTPDQKFAANMVDIDKVVGTIESEGKDCIIVTICGGKMSFTLCLAGKISFNYLPDETGAGEQPRDAFMLYVINNAANTTIEIIKDMHLLAAPDAISPKAELPADLVAHYSISEVEPLTDAVAELTIMIDGRMVTKHLISKSQTTIGRQTGCDIMLENPGISRSHAVIRREGENLVLEDKGSANGTFIGGEKVTTRVLHDGDLIKIMNFTLAFKDLLAHQEEAAGGDAEDAEKTMFVAAPAVKPKAAIAGKLIFEGGTEYHLKSSLTTIGSGDNMEIKLDGRFVAAHQASILMGRGGEATLVDKGGFFRATKVNGEKIQQHKLKSGDAIEIGRYRIVYQV